LGISPPRNFLKNSDLDDSDRSIAGRKPARAAVAELGRGLGVPCATLGRRPKREGYRTEILGLGKYDPDRQLELGWRILRTPICSSIPIFCAGDLPASTIRESGPCVADALGATSNRRKTLSLEPRGRSRSWLDGPFRESSHAGAPHSHAQRGCFSSILRDGGEIWRRTGDRTGEGGGGTTIRSTGEALDLKATAHNVDRLAVYFLPQVVTPGEDSGPDRRLQNASQVPGGPKGRFKTAPPPHISCYGASWTRRAVAAALPRRVEGLLPYA